MKAIITGYLGELLTEKLKKKLEDIIRLAVNEYAVTDFYFGNDENEHEDEADYEEKPYFKKLLKNSRAVFDFILETIKAMKQTNSINAVMVVARPNDNNFNEDLFDEIIQGYAIYSNELVSDNSIEAFDFRDTYLAENVDMIFWYSNKILGKTSSLIRCAEDNKKPIVYV